MIKHADDCGWHVDQYPWECTCGLVYRQHLDRIEQLTAEVERLREALRVMIYETTHLSPMEPDGSHWCRITADALNTARAALGESHD